MPQTGPHLAIPARAVSDAHRALRNAAWSPAARQTRKTVSETDGPNPHDPGRHRQSSVSDVWPTHRRTPRRNDRRLAGKPCWLQEPAESQQGFELRANISRPKVPVKLILRAIGQGGEFAWQFRPIPQLVKSVPAAVWRNPLGVVAQITARIAGANWQFGEDRLLQSPSPAVLNAQASNN